MSKDDEFDEFIEEKTSYLDKLKHIKEVAVYPQELVVLPYETMTLQVSEAHYQKLLSDSLGDDVHLGIAPKSDDGGLPPIGSIGVGADVEKITPLSAKLQAVKIRGVVRFTIDEYIETDKPYPMARITFFEDDKEMRAAEKAMKPQLFREFRGLMYDYNRKHRKEKYFQNPAETLKEKHFETYTFFFWTVCYSSLPAEIREMLLEMRSTTQRAYVLNQQLKRTMKHLDELKAAKNN